MYKRALITGITGQDGAYLTELLLRKGYEVHGIKRRSSSFNTDRIDHLYQDPHEQDARLHLHYGDLTDATNVIRVIQKGQPDEIYNLAAQSHVGVSFEAGDRRSRPAGADQRAIRYRKDCRAQDVPGVPQAARFQRDLYHADESVRARGQFQPAELPCFARAAAQGS